MLGPEDGRPLVRDDEVVPEDADSSVSMFGWAVGVGVLEGAPALWVQAGVKCTGSRCLGHEEECGGAYLLPGSAWEDTVLQADARPNVGAPAGAAGAATLVRGGLTLGGGSDEGAAFRDMDPDENTLLLFDAAPPAGSEAPEADVRIDNADAASAWFGDLDGDGLDDVIISLRTTTIHLSPLASDVRDATADADVTLSMTEFTLDASSSYDDDSDPLTYVWTTSRSYAMIADSGAETTTLTVANLPSTYGETTTYGFSVRLRTIDCAGGASEDYVTFEFEFDCTGI